MPAVSRTTQIMLAALVVLVALFVAAKIRYAGKAPVKLSAEACDRDLWKYVYERERLQAIEECTALDGRVTSVHRNRDGDAHIELDPDRKSVLNLVNATHGHRRLVVEVVCDHEPIQASAKAVCGAFRPEVTIPNVGDRVRVTGAYVTDRDNGWNEVHPVTRIEVLH